MIKKILPLVFLCLTAACTPPASTEEAGMKCECCCKNMGDKKEGKCPMCLKKMGTIKKTAPQEHKM